MSTAGVVGFTQSIVNLNSAGFIGLLTTIPKLIAGVISLTATFGASEVAALGLKGVLDLLKIDPVVLAISALIAVVGAGVIAYNHFNVSLEEHKKALDDAKSEYSSTTSELESLNDQLKTTQDKLSELSGQGSLTVTEQGEYDKLVKTNDELERQIRLKDAIATNQQKQVEKEAIDTLNSNGYYDSKFGRTTYGSEDFWGSAGSKVDAITAAKNYGNVIKTLDGQISDLNQKYKDGEISEEEYSKKSKKLDSDKTDAMKSYGDVIGDIQSEIASLNRDTTEERSIISSANGVIDEYTTLAGVATNATSNLGESMSKAADASSSLFVALESYSSLIEKLSGNFDLVAQAEKELSDNGVLQYSTVQKLLEAYPNLQNSLTLTKDGFVTTKDALDGLITSQIAEYQTANDDAISAANTLINSETAKQLGYKATTGSIYDQLSAMQKLAAVQLAMAGSDFINRRLAAGDTPGEATRNQGYQDIVANANSRYLKVTAAYNNLVASSANLNAAKNLAASIKSSEASKSGSSSKDTTELYIADIDKLASAEQRLTDVQNKLSTEDVLKDLASNSDQKTAIIQKEIGLYKEEQKALENLNAERRKQIQENVSKLQAQGFSVAYNASSNRLAITNMEHINQIVGKTTEETNNLRKAAESLIDTTQTLNDDNIKGTQDWYSSLKSIKSEYEELQSVVSSTVEKAFSKVSDLLNDEKEAYEKQKSNLESVASTVTSYINDYISGLQEQNDELDKQISLQEKLEALDKAKTQRNKRIFKSGEGFVWSADESAVNSAQEEYDSAKREYDLDARIQELQDYADAWKKATDAYQTAIDENLAATILGTNWRSDILGMNYESIYNFQEEYDGVLSELDESIYGSVAYQIKNLGKLQKEWDDSVDAANSAGLDYQSVLDLINTYESGSYETRLSALSSFVSSAISQYQALAAAAAAAAAAASSVSYDSGTDYSQAILDADTLTEAETAAAKREAKISGEGIAGVKSTSSFLDTWKSQHGYANGGVVDYTGPAMVHGATAAEMMLNNADVAKVYDYIHSGDVLAQSAANLLVSSNLSTGSSITPNSDQNITFNMGDVNVSGVQDVNGVADEIVKKLPMAVLQKIYSKKKRR